MHPRIHRLIRLVSFAVTAVSLSYVAQRSNLRADITAEVAWATLELEGEAADIEAGLRWVAETGVRVDPVEDSILEG